MSRRIVQWLASIALLSILAAAVGCSQTTPKPVTATPIKHGRCWVARDPRTFAAPLRPHTWLSLLVQLDLGHGGVYATHDCAGAAIAIHPRSACTGDVAPSGGDDPTAVPIAEESVIERDLGDSLHLIWIITHRFAGGDGYGPIALVKRERAGLETLALGTLRMRTQRVKLERWTLSGQILVVASGETCGDIRDEGGKLDCNRLLHIAFKRGDQLLDPPVMEPSGRCLQHANFELRRRHQRQLPSGLLRSFELQANVSHDGRHVVIEERLQMRDTDTGTPLAGAREAQHVDLQRIMQVEDSHLITQQPSLWNRAIEDAAATTPKRTTSR